MNWTHEQMKELKNLRAEVDEFSVDNKLCRVATRSYLWTSYSSAVFDVSQSISTPYGTKWTNDVIDIAFYTIPFEEDVFIVGILGREETKHFTFESAFKEYEQQIREVIKQLGE